jgi:hypothetical protein
MGAFMVFIGSGGCAGSAGIGVSNEAVLIGQCTRNAAEPLVVVNVGNHDSCRKKRRIQSVYKLCFDCRRC